MAKLGFNFRDTAGYVTDPANTTYLLDEVYPVTRSMAGSGLSCAFGWTSSYGQTYNRSTGVDARLAGAAGAFGTSPGADRVFRVTLPTSGAWAVTVAAMFANSSCVAYWQIIDSDGTTVLASQAETVLAWDHVTDAMGTEFATPAAWVSGNVARSVTFSGTTAYLKIKSSTLDSSGISHISFESASGPTVTTVSSNSATEGSSIVHTVTLSAEVTGSPASYAITLAGGTATGGGTDYTSTLSNGMFSDSVTVSGGNISVPVGVSTFTVTVSTAGDTLDEANETYTLTIGGTAGTGTINDDDAAPTITGTTSQTVTAGSPVVITYSPGLSGQTRTYTLALTDGTAVGGTDYDNTTVTGDFAVTAGTGSVSISGSTVTVDAGVTEFTLTITTTA